MANLLINVILIYTSRILLKVKTHDRGKVSLRALPLADITRGASGGSEPVGVRCARSRGGRTEGASCVASFEPGTTGSGGDLGAPLG